MKKEIPCEGCEHNKVGYCEQQSKVSSVSKPVAYMVDHIQEEYLSDGWNRTASMLGWGKGNKELFDFNKQSRADAFEKFKKLCPRMDRIIELAKVGR